MQCPCFREAEIQDHRDDEDRGPEDRKKNDRHNRDCHPGNLRVMPGSVIIGRNIQVFSYLLFDPALKIVARAACRGESGRGRKGRPG